jgi:hypothetical protein
LAPFPDMSGREGWQEGRKAKYDMETFDEVLVKASEVKVQLLKGVKLADRTYKNHLDGYDQTDLLLGGFERIANHQIRQAQSCYLRWGAHSKVKQLDQLYPGLKELAPPGPTSTIEAAVEQLDLANIIKVSQALSSEIVLEKLIDTLMRTAIEHAGAERGLLILPRDVANQIAAEATTSDNTVIVHLREAFVAEAGLPESIVNYVVRTQESVILDDALSQSPFSEDPYIRGLHARSILCLPLINQAKLIGLLYLENNLSSQVFTPKRITMLKLVASQAAISLATGAKMAASYGRMSALSLCRPAGTRPRSSRR